MAGRRRAEKPDRVNNVENVFVPSAAAGEWTVTVAASTCLRAASPALVVDGAVEEPVEEPVDEPPTVAITTPADDDEVAGTVSIGAEATDDSGVARSSSTSTAVCSGWTPHSPYVVNWNSTSAVNGRHKLRVRAIDTADQTAEAEVTVRLANPLPDEPPP
ncbi:MAG: Ig-like domain-containing protein [Caldilineaceae bacterium]